MWLSTKSNALGRSIWLTFGPVSAMSTAAHPVWWRAVDTRTSAPRGSPDGSDCAVCSNRFTNAWLSLLMLPLTLGGAADEDASLGKVVGPGFASDEIVDAVETVLDTYVSIRDEGERFIETFRRVGMAPFKEGLYPK